MTVLMALLLGAALFGLLQVIATGMAVSSRRGLGFSMSPRDDGQPLDGEAGRVVRAAHNFMETFVFFAVAALVAHVLGRETALAVGGGWIYLLARIVYWPLYVLGVPGVRSLVWVASIIGIVLVGLAAAFG